MIKKRDIVTSIILSFVTCGIYAIIWFISLTDDVGQVSGDERLSGGKCFLLTLITCGIYGYYWAYLMGKAMMQAKAKIICLQKTIQFYISSYRLLDLELLHIV